MKRIKLYWRWFFRGGWGEWYRFHNLPHRTADKAGADILITDMIRRDEARGLPGRYQYKGEEADEVEE